MEILVSPMEFCFLMVVASTGNMQLAKIGFQQGRTQTDQATTSTSMHLRPTLMNVAFSAPIPHGLYGLNATHTRRNCQKSPALSVTNIC